MAYLQRGSVLTAADAAAYDNYGSGVAISADGLVMAVGALSWEGTLTNRGGVYIYDWSGSAWVQRGSVLVAADGAADDWFGISVALNADGTILAVGARQWEGAVLNQGGVYIYDWSGSAWVQRGSVLTADDPGTPDAYGQAVALNGDGTVLAVGAIFWDDWADQGKFYSYDWNGSAWVQRAVYTQSDAAAYDLFGGSVALTADGNTIAVGALEWEGTTSNQGGVYILDWNGSAWAKRGATLVADDPGTYDAYGIAVAFDATGDRLVVGAFLWEGANSNQGKVYIYNRNGSGWTLAETITAADAAADDNFGRSVAINADGSVLVVGAYTWEGGATDQGGVYVFDSAVGTPIAPTVLHLVEIASASAPTVLHLISYGTPTAPTELSLVYPTGTPTAPTRLHLIAYGTPAAPTRLSLIPTAHVPNWTARCTLGGVDVSDRLTGVISVTAEEGAARVASVTLLPASGAVAPLDYVGQTITLDYVLLVSGAEIARRVFTGLVDTPDYDPASTRLQLRCTDDLQNRVAALTRAEIDALTGGRYSVGVQGDPADGWDYAQAVMTTVAGSLDASAAGGLRLTPWVIDSSWATYADADLIYQRSAISYPKRSTLVNHVAIEYDYRYARLRQRFAPLAWGISYAEAEAAGFRYPTIAEIKGSAGGSGWQYISGGFVPAPAAIPYEGKFVYPNSDGIQIAVMKLTQRHSQTVTERYAITVDAPESIALNGTLTHTLRGALSSSFDGQAWESAYDIAPLMPEGGEQDYAPDADRDDSDHAIQTLLDQANVKILGSHRSARLTNAVPCDPSIDLDKRLTIATTSMSATGKVAAVTHTLDLASGSAVTQFSIACFGLGGAGVLTPDELTPPAPPEEATETQDWPADMPNLITSVAGQVAYSDSAQGLLMNTPRTITIASSPGVDVESVDNPHYTTVRFPVAGFRMAMPGVDDSDRNPIEKTVEQSYSIIVPTDTLEFTVP